MDTSKLGVYFKEPWRKILQGMGDNLPLLLEAGLIILAGFFFAFLFRYITFRILTGLQKLLRKKMKVPSSSLRRLDYSGAKLASRIVFWGVLLFFLAASLHVLNQPVISKGLNTLAGYFPNLLAAALIVFLGFIAGNIFGATAHKIFASSKIGSGELYGRITKYLIVVTASLVAIEQLGINISLLIVILAILTGMVAGGVALAFALGAKDTVQNILATHYLEKLYQVGQRLRVGDIEGKILQMDSTYLILETSEGNLALPASWLSRQPVLLLSHD